MAQLGKLKGVKIGTRLGMENGTYISVNGMEMEFRGEANGVVLEHRKDIRTIQPGDNISDLLVAK